MSRLWSPGAEALRVQWEADHPEEQYGWLGLRVRRATSWLSRAEAEMRDEPRATRMPPSFFSGSRSMHSMRRIRTDSTMHPIQAPPSASSVRFAGWTASE